MKEGRNLENLLYCRQGRTTSPFYCYKKKNLLSNKGPVETLGLFALLEMKECCFSSLRIRVPVESRFRTFRP